MLAGNVLCYSLSCSKAGYEDFQLGRVKATCCRLLDAIFFCSGEAAFFHMQYNFGWAKRPMLARIETQLSGETPVTMIYGIRSSCWDTVLCVVERRVQKNK